MNPQKEKALEIHQRLLRVYGEPRWRNPLPPMDELISTILSQNTNDLNRDRAFERLRERYPTWEAVRDAPIENIIEAIRPAGLANQKGPRIQTLLHSISEETGGLNLDFLQGYSLPEAREWFLKFKGVGPKTAAIVLLFSLGMPAFPVDTHVHRVTSRLGLLPNNMNAQKAHPFLEELLPSDTYYAVHLNLIRHGREVCKARNPSCSSCVLADRCDYDRDQYA